MKKKLILLFSAGLFCSFHLAGSNPTEVDHKSWSELLKKHVSEDGKVDYTGFKNDKAHLTAYLQLLSQDIPDDSWTEAARLAYWINAYNAFTIALIIEHYPVKSIMDINKAWDIKFISLGDKLYTLNEIEHKIIRKEFSEPRIHFALVCAAYSCPVLLNEAYMPGNLDNQLQKQGLRFINDPNHNDIKADKIKISQLFNWFREDFVANGTLIEYLNSFSHIKIKETAQIKFMEYNWNLNE